ncbi:sigma 54-interacting transcriptional regulator [Tissierella sp. Yu-01]|uniref:sigma-54 interaction domain-containing protein n=1 Tax=Tissierella sp. Yu-01 TaxID=3035694 RepID=UPI00240D1CD9|nr:sigma 54-interacting transcriptional regulator [Tissierella sp. Yu-01]WFA09076.1 sigma 54-interacting transcriptional regulator [Tissierella sp. Yu-01]
MDIKLIGEIIYNYKPYSIIIDRQGVILWFSKKMETLLNIEEGNNIDSLLSIKYKDLFSHKNIKITIGKYDYNISRLFLKHQELIVLTFDIIGDYNEAETKSLCLGKIIENLYDGVLLSDKEGRVVIYNRAMEELEKHDAKEMLGKYIWDAYGYSDVNKSEHMQVFNSGIPIINKYKAHAYNNGKPVYKSYSTFPIQVDGDIIGVYSISKDETKLQNLLAETVELRRQYSKDTDNDNKIYKNGTRFNFSDIIGSSESMTKLIKEAEAISWLDNSVLLVGDTGTGKEVFAQSIHNFGKRKTEPFIGINCSAIPENLLESILFGSVKGAYTGAVDSSGLFEEAGQGTLFLDELNSMPINMQTKLLRVLQEKSVRRVGGKENYPIKCRIISAMNEDPYVLIEEGKLRQDLFYRIAGYNLYIPPLKDRDNDLFELAEYYISKNNLAMNKNVISISDELRNMMINYGWPGNIRELEHFIENIMVRTNEFDRYLRVENIPSYILDVMDSNDVGNIKNCNTNQPLQEVLDNMEHKLIIQALDNNKWNVTKSADELGVTRQSLIYRMKKLNIVRD